MKYVNSPLDLEDYQNLATNAKIKRGSITDSTELLRLKDLDRNDVLPAQGAPITIIFDNDDRISKNYGIYKVILYAKSDDDSIAGWEVCNNITLI